MATTHGLNLTGYPAWLAWLLLHLYYLIGFRNRTVVMLNWAYYYWFHERQVRLITDNERGKRQIERSLHSCCGAISALQDSYRYSR